MLKALTHGATLLKILHAIVAIGLSPLEIVSCNIAEVETESTSAILCAKVSELTHGAISTLSVILCAMLHTICRSL